MALFHFQADLRVPEPTTYESEDEIMGRRKQVAARAKKGTPLYSKEDIREQYCINEKQLHGLEDVHDSGGLFGCLSNYHVRIPVGKTKHYFMTKYQKTKT